MRYVQQNGILVPQTSRNRQRGFITCAPAFFGTGTTPPPVTQAVWSATLKASTIDLTPDRTNATGNTTSGVGMVLSASAKTSGKYYVEIKQDKNGAGSNTASNCGLHAGTSGLTLQVGDDANGWGTLIYGAGGGTRGSYHSGTITNSSALAWADHQTARMAVDLDAGKIWLSKFGSSSWLGGGDPASGTSPTFIFTPSGDYYFAGCPVSQYQSLTIVAPGSWVYSAPSGFGVWTA
jgi:hypothetical protein